MVTSRRSSTFSPVDWDTSVLNRYPLLNLTAQERLEILHGKLMEYLLRLAGNPKGKKNPQSICGQINPTIADMPSQLTHLIQPWRPPPAASETFMCRRS